MTKYAIIRLQGRQYEVIEGSEILVDKVADPKKVEAEVLLLSIDGKVQIGKPVLKDVKIGLKVLVEEEKGEKIEVYHFKAKSRYKKHTGHRAKYTRVLVEKIS
jgi:large subunit ribosomal protein L21